MDEPGGSPTAKKSKNGKVAFTPEIEAECVAACSAGFTIEKCAGLIGVPIGTLKTWTHRFPSFAVKMETARKKHELSLLRDIELAGQKSWQAKAWILERRWKDRWGRESRPEAGQDGTKVVLTWGDEDMVAQVQQAKAKETGS